MRLRTIAGVDADDDPKDHTYRYLRAAPVVICLALGVSLLLSSVAIGATQNSVSQYFYTASHSVFVGAVCAVGVCLIVNHGFTPAENVLLDFAGFFALLVALVPTGRDGLRGPVIDYPTEPGVWNNVPSLLIAAAAALALKQVYLRATGTLDRAARLALAGGAAVLVAVLALMLWRRDSSGWLGPHELAAIALFAFMFAVVALNALTSRGIPAAWHDGYRVVAWAMPTTLGLVLACAALGLPSWVFWLEALLIVEFMAFWIVQTLTPEEADQAKARATAHLLPPRTKGSARP